jgi:hypothetical protein
MKNDWKNFIDGLGVPVEFLHKDEFSKQYSLKGVKFPFGFLKKGPDIKLFISTEEIDECKTLGDLKELVTKKVKQIPALV